MKIILVKCCGECPEFVRGPRKGYANSAGCKASWTWFGTGVDAEKIAEGCPLKEAPKCFDKVVK